MQRQQDKGSRVKDERARTIRAAAAFNGFCAVAEVTAGADDGYFAGVIS